MHAQRARKLTSLLMPLWLLCAGQALAQDPTPAAIREAVNEHAVDAISLYREFLGLPNDARKPEDIETLLVWIEQAFGHRGFATERLPTGGAPALLAQRTVSEDASTILAYLQADGQPVDPAAWDQADPFLAVLKEQDADGQWSEIPWARLEQGVAPDWRVFARSAADSKGPMTQFMLAVELLDGLGFKPDYNLKVLIDTEEELGSPNLAEAVAANREKLAADMLLIFDGPPHASNRPTVSFGARGIATITLTTYGPKVAQHSGHYGNFVPNPAMRLAQLLASMKATDGRVLIPGFYAGVELDDETRERLADVPDDEAAILAALGVAEADAVAGSLQEAIQYPSLNIRGLRSAWVGDEVRTIIPASATAEIDIRLVSESDPERLIALVREHVQEQGYHVTDTEPTEAERQEHPRIAAFSSHISYGAFRSNFDDPPGLRARAAMRALYGEEPILIRSMGGSIPIAPIIASLGVPAAIVPTVNMDNNQHSPNENLRLGNFFEGIAIVMAVLGQSAESPAD